MLSCAKVWPVVALRFIGPAPCMVLCGEEALTADTRGALVTGRRFWHAQVGRGVCFNSNAMLYALKKNLHIPYANVV